MHINKSFLNFIIIIGLSLITLWWTFYIYHDDIQYKVVFSIITFRLLASRFILRDYSQSWSKASTKTFLVKSIVYIIPFLIYLPIFYGEVRFSFLFTELLMFLFLFNLLVYSRHFYKNRDNIIKNKKVIIYGAGSAGIKLEKEFNGTDYRVDYFIDNNKALHNRSIDGIKIISENKLKNILEDNTYDLLIIAMPSALKNEIDRIHTELKNGFNVIKILPSLNKILLNSTYTRQLKDLSVEDLLSRSPKDLDTKKIELFIQDKCILITGAGGSIGSEICRQCEKYGAKKLILLDHSEFNLYSITEELLHIDTIPVMQSVTNKDLLRRTFEKYKPEMVIHAAAYKHVPLVEENIEEAILNNILGSKNVIDISIEFNVDNVVLISTDKAVRPTNVMGTTKRITELYAQNVESKNTEIVAVRFGNVLGSSGSVIPKFREQIKQGGPITVTHPEITRYFMLIPEACQLVLQAGTLGKRGEIFILDMGEPIKIVDLAKKMIEIRSKNPIEIEFTGLRPGEKLYEELLIDDSDAETEYESITVAKATKYDIQKLNRDIEILISTDDKLKKLKDIVPEFNHKLHN